VDLALENDFGLGGLSVRPSTRQVETPAGAETVEPRIMQVLVALARRRGEVVSREELLKACWDGVVVGEDSISRCIYRLRKLGEATGAFSVETIPRVGYRLAETRAATVDRPASLSRRGGQPRWVWIGVIALAAIAGVLAMALLGGPRPPPPSSAARLAVLPFDAIGSGPAAAENARLAPGVIADALQKAGETVLSPAVSASYSGDRKPQAPAGLGVDYIVDGEVSGGDPLRLLLRLISAEGVIIWSEEFLGEQKGADGLLARASVRAVAMVQALQQARADGIRTAAGQVAYLSSQNLGELGDPLGSWREAKRLVAAEPNNAAALLSAAIAGGVLLGDLPPAERAAVLAESRAYIGRARAIDPGATGLAEAILQTTPPVNIGFRLQVLEEALAAHSHSAQLRTVLAEELYGAGRLKDAVRAAQLAVKQEPASRNAVTGLAMTLVLAGRMDEAIDAADRAMRTWPAHYPLVRARFEGALWAGDYAEARRLYADPSNTLLIQPMAPTRPLESIIKALESRASSDIAAAVSGCSDPFQLRASGWWYCLAAMSALGRMDEAFALVATAPRMTGDTPAERDAMFLDRPHIAPQMRGRLFLASSTALREDPRIIDLFERFGLLDYWRSSGKWPDFCEAEPKSVCARMKGSG
jgi:DNA-binding winged helix-turn-helix (wHTH) protein/tetratricopeptide (TPR) repeat protein